ncbi:ABC transporter permease [Frankia sp. AgB32]|uniref:ABC transporter permease n=1 Tax=Frankia sp. AgB32 TaxID=631119 RepID=UPI00200DF7C6|nr:ABC transporter permease [Frankia sp. AgB32]MCK9895733.1 ABC transporter permease [Frankia sp. AgB32]
MTAATLERPGSADGPAAAAGYRVTQLRVLRSEWTKLRSLRSTLFSLLAAIVFVVGLGCLISWARADHWNQESPLERLTFDPTSVSLSGVFLAQLAIGVLGVLTFSGEYGTGMIRATLTAVPHRLPVLWAKAAVFAVVTFVLMTISAFAAFFLGQAMLSSRHIETTLGHPGVLTAVLGGGLYLTVVGLLGVGLGALIRSTAGGIATLFGVLLVLPLIVHFLPSNWSTNIDPYLPSSAGQAILAVVPDPTSMAPWNGFALFCGYAAALLAGAAVALRRRDA